MNNPFRNVGDNAVFTLTIQNVGDGDATGYDAVVLEGAAAEPVYLEISDAGVRFHDAAHLWGRETYGTEDALKAEVGVRGASV